MKLLTAALALVPAACLAQASLHTAPIGTVVEGSFVLADKAVPLPPGKFRLVSAQERASKVVPQGASNITTTTSPIAEVLLVQSEGTKLRAAVWAKANAGVASRWVTEPCKRGDTLFRLDRTKSTNYLQDCVLVNHFMGFLSKPSGMLTGAYDALKAEGVEMPVKTVLEAALTRIDQREYLEILYRVNPEAFGFAPESGLNWATSEWHPSRIAGDARKSAFAKALTDWALGLEPVVDRGFRGKPIAPGAIPALQLPAGS